MTPAKQQPRFIEGYSQSFDLGTNVTKIMIDTVTGVNYLFYKCANGSGLTVLVDGLGMPVVTPPELLPH